jgi:hypothetical protein
VNNLPQHGYQINSILLFLDLKDLISGALAGPSPDTKDAQRSVASYFLMCIMYYSISYIQNLSEHVTLNLLFISHGICT